MRRSQRRSTPQKTRKASPPPQILARVRRQKDGYEAARRQHASEIAEDYVELIAELIREQGEARSVDMAERLGVSHVTVAKTVQRLRRDGLVQTQPYRAIFLTPQGQKLAADCRSRHDLVVAFLRALGVREETAQRDAEGIEHHVSDETLRAMRDLVSRARQDR